MTVHLKYNEELKPSVVQYLPCKIHFDGEASVDSYFTLNKDSEGLKASFRGYPLAGKKLNLAALGYRGNIFKESRRPNAENMTRHLNATHSFDSLVFWNWDHAVSKADPLISALDWIDLAKAVHCDSDEE